MLSVSVPCKALNSRERVSFEMPAPRGSQRKGQAGNVADPFTDPDAHVSNNGLRTALGGECGPQASSTEILGHLVEMQNPRPTLDLPHQNLSIYRYRYKNLEEFICKLKPENRLLYRTNLTKFIFSLNEVVLS